MKAKNVEDAVRLPHADVPVAVAVPAEDGELIAATSAESADTVCGSALGIAGWISLILNAANVVSMSVACYQLNEYLNAPHPDNDSYAIAGVAYLIFVPSLIDSILMALLIAYVLHGEYRRGVQYDGVDEGFTKVGKKQRCCLAVVCVVLLIISLWPTCVGIAIAFPEISHTSTFRLSSVVFATVIWVAVTVSFAAFAIVLFTRLCTRHMS